MEQPSEILRKLADCKQPIEFVTTPSRVLILIAQLQLALRHPGNTGKSAEVAREFITNMTRAVCSQVPEAQELIDMGNNPAYDVTREYAASEFFGEQPDEQ